MIRSLLNLPNDDSRKIIFVAVSLCLVCSLMVSSAAVFLAPIQAAQAQESLRRNVLIAAGLLDAEDDAANVNQLFGDIEARIVDLDVGEFTDAVNPATFDPDAAVRGPTSVELTDEQDVAGIGRRERYARVYVVRDGDDISRLVLPIRGRGLWSTMFAYVALEGDFNTVAAINYFNHGETPGLGEVDDPEWQALWVGRKIYDDAGEPKLKVIRGRVNPDSPNAIHEIDGMAGATLTGNGVSNTIVFWFGDSGFRPFLDKLRTEGA